MSLRPSLEEDQSRLTPFIDREDELDLLKQIFARAVRETSTQLVTVTGEAGVGKSRLITEFLVAADQRPEPILWLRGRCVPSGQGIAFWPLREMVRTQSGIGEADDAAQATAKVAAQVERIIREPSERDWFAGRLAALAGGGRRAMDENVERNEWFAAWQRFFQAVASTLPLILVFEDLHWAAPALLEFVEQLVDWSTGVPLLVVCTARPELYEQSPRWGGGKRASMTIGLLPLSAEETVRLLSSLLSQAVLPAETQQVLIERSGGNPLYAEEFVRMLVDRRILVRQDQVWRLDPKMDIPVPDTAHELIGARIDALSPQLRAVLMDASVFGKVFWAGGVATMEGVDEAAIQEQLHELARKELVRPARTSWLKDDREFSFLHRLVRDVAYEGISADDRATKHLAVARWLEHVWPDRAADEAEVLAHHYEEALPAVEWLDADQAAALRDRASRSFAVAGDRTVQLDVPSADTWFAMALALRPPDDPERPAVLAKAARTASLRGDFPAAVSHIEEAVSEFRVRGNDTGAGEVMLDLAYLLWNQGWTVRSREVLAEAVELLERQPPGPELAAAYAQLAGDRFIAGQPRDALDLCEKSLALASERDLPDLRVRVLEVRGMSRCDLGDWEGLEDLHRALESALELGLGEETVRAYLNYATFVTPVEGPHRALELFRAGVEFADRRGLLVWKMWTTAWELGVLFEVGEWDRLLTDAHDVLEWDPEKGESTFGVGALLCKAEVLAYRGKVSEALKLAERFVPRAREIGDPQVVAPALAIAAVCQEVAGDLPAAVATIQQLNAASSGGSSWVRSLFLQLEVRVLVAAGRLDDADAALAGAERKTPRGRLTALTSEAVLADARGRWDEAAQKFRDAADGWFRYGFPLERGRALLGLGRALVQLEEAKGASKALREAREIFERLRAKWLLVETDRTLERASRRAL